MICPCDYTKEAEENRPLITAAGSVVPRSTSRPAYRLIGALAPAAQRGLPPPLTMKTLRLKLRISAERIKKT
jgi:hypothetical protein